MEGLLVGVMIGVMYLGIAFVVAFIMKCRDKQNINRAVHEALRQRGLDPHQE